MKKIVIKENDANQRIDKFLRKVLQQAPYVMHLVILYIRCLEKKILKLMVKK